MSNQNNRIRGGSKHRASRYRDREHEPENVLRALASRDGRPPNPHDATLVPTSANDARLADAVGIYQESGADWLLDYEQIGVGIDGKPIWGETEIPRELGDRSLTTRQHLRVNTDHGQRNHLIETEDLKWKQFDDVSGEFIEGSNTRATFMPDRTLLSRSKGYGEASLHRRATTKGQIQRNIDADLGIGVRPPRVKVIKTRR